MDSQVAVRDFLGASNSLPEALLERECRCHEDLIQRFGLRCQSWQGQWETVTTSCHMTVGSRRVSSESMLRFRDETRPQSPGFYSTARLSPHAGLKVWVLSWYSLPQRQMLTPKTSDRHSSRSKTQAM